MVRIRLIATKQISPFVIALVSALAVCGCSISRPITGEQILTHPEGTNIVIHTELHSYRFYTYTMHESMLTGLSQTYKPHAPGEPTELDSRYPPLYRNIELRDVLRTEAIETRFEPIESAILYGAIPCAAIIGVLVPIITHGTP